MFYFSSSSRVPIITMLSIMCLIFCLLIFQYYFLLDHYVIDLFFFHLCFSVISNLMLGSPRNFVIVISHIISFSFLSLFSFSSKHIFHRVHKHRYVVSSVSKVVSVYCPFLQYASPLLFFHLHNNFEFYPRYFEWYSLENLYSVFLKL